MTAPVQGQTLVHPLVRESDNFLRFRRHTFAPIAARGVRLLVHATWGAPHAEVFDWRVYRSPCSA